MRAAGGRVTIGQAAGRFSLTAELPLETRELGRSGFADLRSPWPQAGTPGRRAGRRLRRRP